jgi:hypothetical protein
MTITVSGADGLVGSAKEAAAIDGMIDGIANFTGVPSAYVDVDLTAELDRRRLRSQQQQEQSKDTVLTYAIAVSGEAPESVVTTGSEVVTKLAPENRDAIEDAMSSWVSTEIDLTVKRMSTPQVTVSSSAQEKSEANLNPHNSVETNLGPHNSVVGLAPYASFVICGVAVLLMA